MPVAAPRELSLLQSLQSAIRAMTTAGGFDWTVKSTSVVLDAVNIFDISDANLPFFIVESSAEGARDFRAAGWLEDVFVAVITARVVATGASPDRRTSLGWTLAANLEKALVADIERGGLAFDTRLRKPEIWSEMGESGVLVVQRVEMPFQREYGDPA